MEGNIQKVETAHHTCTFKMDGIPNWKVVGIRTYGTRRCRFSVFNAETEEYCLFQKSLLKQLFSLIPFVGFLYQNPFYFSRGQTCCGYSKNKTRVLGQGRDEFHFEEDVYFLTIHSKGVHSLLKNERQVAVYKRHGDGNYRVRYSQEIANEPDSLILYAAFAELYFTLDTAAAVAPQNFTVPNDKFLDRARWLPEDDIDKEPFLNRYGL